MRFLARTLISAVAALIMIVPAGAAMTGGGYGAAAASRGFGAIAKRGYSGSWPVTVTRSQHSNGTDCLTLTDDGSGGFLHSGSASVVIRSSKYEGSFQVINNVLVATLDAQGYSQNAGLAFIAAAGHGNIGQGAYEEVYGGGDFDTGALAFGTKGGC